MKEVASEMKAQGPQRHLDPDSGYPRESSHASRVRFWIILIQLSNKAFLLCFLSVGFSFLEFIWLLERRQNHERMVSLGWRRSACVETGPGIDRNPVLVCSPLLGETLTPKTAWEGKGSLPLTVYSLPWRGARGGAQGGNRKSRKPSRKAASLLHTVFPAGSLGRLSRCGTAHSRRGPPCIRPLLKTPHTLTYRPTWWEHFLMWVPLFPNDSGLYQVYKK